MLNPFEDVLHLEKNLKAAKFDNLQCFEQSRNYIILPMRYGSPKNTEVWSMQQFYFLMISAYLLLYRVNKSPPNNMMQLGLNIVLDCSHYMPYLLPEKL
jgi:hypothetical protein